MKLDLTKEDLISLVKGTPPNYDAMDNPKIKPHGSFAASYSRWSWGYNAFKDYTESELYEIYLILKNSWNEK